MRGRYRKFGHRPCYFCFAMHIVCLVSVLCVGFIDNGYARDKNPPEVEALIGMQIQAHGPGEPGRIPGWRVIQSSTLSVETHPQFLGYEELIRGSISIFIIDRLDKRNLSRTILDAHVLPLQLLTYRVTGGKAVARQDRRSRYTMQTHCSREGIEGHVIALARPKPGMEQCENAIAEVRRAWRIDGQTGKIEDIPTSGVTCTFVTGIECYPF